MTSGPFPLKASSKVILLAALFSGLGYGLNDRSTVHGPRVDGGCTTPAPSASFWDFFGSSDALAADYAVTVQGSPLAWKLNTVVNPTITLTRGQSYTFDLTATASNHPFVINSNAANASGTVYAGPSFGTTITFTPDFAMPSTIYYHCTIHQSSMVGTINLVSPADFTVTVNPDLTWNVNGQPNPALTLTRGHTYLFNLTGFGGQHPFVINGNSSDAGGSIYAGPASGTMLSYAPDAATPSTIYYHCQVHFTTMVGTINVVDPPDFVVLVNPELTWSVNGQTNPALTLYRGQTYTFDLTGFGGQHPFVINENADDAGGTIYAGPAPGTILSFTPDQSTPAQVYYHCQVHFTTMVGTITVLDPPDFLIQVNPELTWNVNGETNPTLTLTRGQTYSFDLNAVSDHHPFVINEDEGDPDGTIYAGPAFQQAIAFTPDESTPATIYYHCQVHFTTMTGMINIVSPMIAVSAKAFLEGPFVSATVRMKDDLRAAGVIPLTEPYTAMGYLHMGGGGGETVAPTVLAIIGDDAIVDWVVVELRSAATPSTVLATRSALVQRDGDIVASDGGSPVPFNLPAGSYDVAIRHRTHLGIMTLNPVALSTSTTTVDLSSVSTATYGTNACKTVGSTQVMWMGDTNFSGVLLYTGSGNDRDPILVKVGSTTPNNTVTGYWREDLTMDGAVKYTGSANDRDPILVNVGSTTPNNVRVQQLP
jgi:hypothetical protein